MTFRSYKPIELRVACWLVLRKLKSTLISQHPRKSKIFHILRRTMHYVDSHVSRNNFGEPLTLLSQFLCSQLVPTNKEPDPAEGRSGSLHETKNGGKVGFTFGVEFEIRL